jgi:hypothetical protein
MALDLIDLEAGFLRKHMGRAAAAACHFFHLVEIQFLNFHSFVLLIMF